MKNYGGHLKLEAFANISSSLLSDLNEEISKLRKSGDYSQDSLEKSQVGEIIKAHTGIKAGIETGFFLCLVHILFRFQHILPLF